MSKQADRINRAHEAERARMTKPKWTPRSWHVQPDYPAGNVYLLWDRRDNYPKDLSAGAMDANTPLIASAPTLAALASHILAMKGDAYLDGHPEWPAIVAEAEAALKAARGDT